MNPERRIDRRAWLARLGVTVAGVSGAVVAMRHGSKLGVVTPARAGAPATALRVNLGFVSAYVVTRGNSAAIIDTGVAGSAGAIGEVVQAAGLDWSSVQHLILTHSHPDHAGSAAELLALAPGATVWIGAADLPNVPLPRAARPANDGDDIFGLRVVATPGHTAGHISMLDPTAGMLFVGDAAVNVPQLLASPPQFTADQAQAHASVRRLGSLTFEQALFGHGEPIEAGAAAAFQALGGSLT